MRQPVITSILLGASVALSSCTDQTSETRDEPDAAVGANGGEIAEPEPMTAPDPAGPEEPEVGEAPWVETTFIDRDGDEIGNVSIEPVEQGVRIAMHVEGLSPGPHAVHFHEHGVCEPPGFQSAGGHFNPAGASHGMPDADTDLDDPDHHAGDMLNQEVDDQELLSTVMINRSVRLSGSENSLLEGDGTALIIHAGPDDYESQPSGDAGDRVACAPITLDQSVGTR